MRGERKGKTREVAQQLRAIVDFPKDLGSSPTTCMASHNYLQLQFRRPNALFWSLQGTKHTGGTHTNM